MPAFGKGTSRVGSNEPHCSKDKVGERESFEEVEHDWDQVELGTWWEWDNENCQEELVVDGK